VQFGETEISFYANYVLLALLMAAVAFMLVRRLERSWIGLPWTPCGWTRPPAPPSASTSARWKIIAFTLGNFSPGWPVRSTR